MVSSFNNSNLPAVLSYHDQYHPTYLDAPPMDRGRGSRSSIGSGYSNSSYPGKGYSSSPGSSYCNSSGSPSYDYMTPRGSSPHRNSIPDQSFELVAPTEEIDLEAPRPDQELPLFDPNQGDPRIAWHMYYDFEVNKTEAYWKLKDGYLASREYPDRIKSHPSSIGDPDPKKKAKGEKRHPCLVPHCTAKPFTRHYDLERHFGTVHGLVPSTQKDVKVEIFYCDYPKCPHEEPFRKDHCREHYREFHLEDLVKLNPRPKNLEDEKWWDRRRIPKAWWRCSRCLQRTKTNDGWKCKNCSHQCEQDRQIARKKIIEDPMEDDYSSHQYEQERQMTQKEIIDDPMEEDYCSNECEQERQMARKKIIEEPMEEDYKVGFSTAFSDPAGSYATRCYACEGGWIEHEPSRWFKCNMCNPEDPQFLT